MTSLLSTVRAAHPGVDTRPIERAYTVAARLHHGQRRKSDDPYITHPIAVATIVAEMGMSPETVCAALLHDTIETLTTRRPTSGKTLVRSSRASLRASPDYTRSKSVLMGRARTCATGSWRYLMIPGSWS